jgi:hypothetical protein
MTSHRHVGQGGHVYTQVDPARRSEQGVTRQTMLLPPTGN